MICKLNKDNCIACGICYLIAPELFDYDPYGIVMFQNNMEQTKRILSDSEVPNALQACKQCPTRAICIEHYSDL